MKDTFDEQRYYRERLPMYQRPRRRGRGLLYLFFFMLGSLTTIALSTVINPGLMQALLGLFVQALYALLAWLWMHPLVLMLCVVVLLILVIIEMSRDRW